MKACSLQELSIDESVSPSQFLRTPSFKSSTPATVHQTVHCVQQNLVASPQTVKYRFCVPTSRLRSTSDTHLTELTETTVISDSKYLLLYCVTYTINHLLAFIHKVRRYCCVCTVSSLSTSETHLTHLLETLIIYNLNQLLTSIRVHCLYQRPITTLRQLTLS